MKEGIPKVESKEEKLAKFLDKLTKDLTELRESDVHANPAVRAVLESLPVAYEIKEGR